MIALHKPERATYGQAIEAQIEFALVKCVMNPPEIHCKRVGIFNCCV